MQHVRLRFYTECLYTSSCTCLSRRTPRRWQRGSRRRRAFFFSTFRHIPTANAGDPRGSEGTYRRISSRPFQCYPPTRSGPRRSPSASADKLPKIDPCSGRVHFASPRVLRACVIDMRLDMRLDMCLGMCADGCIASSTCEPAFRRAFGHAFRHAFGHP